MRYEPVWLTRRMIGEIHHEQISEHGGSYGVRDDGLIDSALARPRNRWEYAEDVNLSGLAAAYGYGLAKNHGFVDGNKRVGFMAMYVFLRLNGVEIEAGEPEVVRLMTAVASGALGEEELAAWLKQSVVSR